MTPKPSKYPFSGHSYAMRATWQSGLNCKVTISFTFLSFQESEELHCRYRDQPEHQMRHHFGCPTHPHEPSPIIVLQIRVDPLGRAAIPETHRLRRIHLFLLSPPGVGIDDGNMPQSDAVAPDLRCIVGRGCLRIMQRGRTQNGAYRNVPINRINMHFVAGPACLVSLGIDLGAHVAPCWQISHVLCQATSKLQIQPFRFFCRFGLALAWTPSLAFRLALGGFLFFANRLLASIG